MIKKALQKYTFIRFLISGGISFIVDFTVLLLITHIFFGGKNFSLFGFISLPQMIASIVGLSVNFLFNRAWVFEKNESQLKSHVLKFIAFTVFNVLLASILFDMYYDIFTSIITTITIPFVSILLLASVAKEATKMVISFIGYKYFVFK
jgi:putative flippase GtrA